jgi:hypothetical protein
MATLTSAKVASGVQPKVNATGDITVTGYYSVTATLVAADVIQMVKIPAGATVIGGRLFGSSGTALVTVGDGDSAARYISSTSIVSPGAAVAFYANIVGSAGTAAGVFPYTYSANDTIDITIGTVATGTVVGAFSVSVTYTMDP